MYLVEFVKEAPDIKPKVNVGERALLDKWRYERYLQFGTIKLLKEIKIARTPILERDERIKYKKALESLKILEVQP